ncbi:MAG: EAL domain-containing protein [Thermoleophilia bacterium]
MKDRVSGEFGADDAAELLGGEQLASGERMRAMVDAVAALVGRMGERRPDLADAAAAPLPPPQHNGLRDALQTALRDGEFMLAYQPQVSLVSDRIVAAEALLRWDRPDGVVSPKVFVPLAEETGDIVAIGEWVLRQACEQAAQWKRTFPRLLPWHVSVNVSPRQFDDGLVEVVGGALDHAGLDAASLRLEVTETTLIEDIELGRSVIVQLRDLGVSLALDDFGTGYSSLAYLRQLDLDEVKIDQAFVRGLGANVSDTAIVASVLSLAHALNRTVVAEGVETTGQLEHLRSLGCDLAQGFLLAPPMPPEELALLIGESARGVRLRPGTDDDGEPALQTVLVVDDEPVIRQLARMCLTAGGFSIEEAGTGSSALAASRRSPPACVLLDVELPDSSGLDVCAALRQHPATSDCTIVVLTSAAQNMTKAEAFAAGADDYIVKPFVPRDLCARVRAALRRRETG